MRIEPFTQGPRALVKKMNEITAAVNSLLNATGDGLIQITRTPLGMKFRINPERIAPFIPRAGGKGGVIWAIVTQVPEYNDPDKAKFIVQKAVIATVENNEVWQGSGTDIEITRAIGFEGYDTAGEDIRNWSPWPAVDSIVKIIARDIIVTDTELEPPLEVRESAWFLDYPIMFGGDETDSSFRADPDTGAAQAVWA